MKLLALGLLLLCWIHVCVSQQKPLGFPKGSKDWIRKEVSAVILMTLEFVRDMGMKMRDVHRIEKSYENFDFHAAQLLEDVKEKFNEMVEFYKDYGSVEYLFGRNRNPDQLLSEVVGSLQLMLSEYNELLTLVDVFRQSFLHWKNSVTRGSFREKITEFLSSRDIYPSNHKDRPDEW